jgi:uncharacterized protein (DUF1778 family)
VIQALHCFEKKNWQMPTRDFEKARQRLKAAKTAFTVRHNGKNGRRPLREERLEARVTPEQKQLIARAAALRGSSITEFIVSSAEQAAVETLKDFEVLTLHDEARDVFVNAVLHASAPN